MSERGVYASFSPLDYRYYNERLAPYLSEEAFIKYKAKVEAALVKVLFKRGLCSLEAKQEIMAACDQVTAVEVYQEEARIRHDIRALVNCICLRVSQENRWAVHLMATSFDIIDTANAARYRDALQEVIIPLLINLELALLEIVEREAATVQIGRTHGQHAVPITFGFALAQYLDRLGGCILSLRELAKRLVGKFAGAVGAYNASTLFFEDPLAFEKEVLAELGLEPALISTQIVPSEPLIRVLQELGLAAGVMANLARDLRHLQRTEIGEVGEEFGGQQVGSSTMPQKRNPIGLENVEGIWKIVQGHLVTVHLDQISEHQRDLTGSAPGRTYGEIFAYVGYMADRLAGILRKLRVDKANMEANFAQNAGLIVAEPLYILLAAKNHPEAHEVVRQLTMQATAEGKSLLQVAQEAESLQPYLTRFTPEQTAILQNPADYTGQAAQKARLMAAHWRETFVFVSI